MLWRLASALILIFWAVMTTLLVRHTYFPAEAEFAPVPMSLLMQRFASTAMPSNTLQLRQGKTLLGNATLAIVDWKDTATGASKGYTWQVGGMIEAPPDLGQQARVTWNFSGDYTTDGRWERIALSARSSATDTFVNVSWKLGQELPVIEVRKGDKIVMDTATAMEQAKSNPMLAGMGGMTSMLPSFLGNKAVSLEHLINLSAKEASIRLGNRQRKAFLLTASLMNLYQTKAWFTEAGEIIKVDLPQGYRLTNPLVFGLDGTE